MSGIPVVGIVVVSHSRALGEAVAALAKEMAVGSEAPPIAVAAGLDEDTFGTDATAVAAAIEEAGADDAAVLVLVDIGSSVLSAEMACELIDPELAERVRISAAPLVEGIVPAIVSAAAGAGLDEVAGEAEEGLEAKRAHLDAGRVPEERSGGGVSRPSDLSPDTQPRSPAATRPTVVEIVITDPHGLHARPAAKLVALVRSYDARVTLTDLDTGAGPVPATSLSKVATLNAGHGARLRVAADGPQAGDVVDAVRDLATSGFEDPAPDDTARTEAIPSQGGTSPAQGSGLEAALGPAHVRHDAVDLEEYQPGSASEEQIRSDRAVEAVVAVIRQQQSGDPAGEGAEILGAHLVLLQDDAMLADVAERIARGGSAPTAWREVLHALATEFERLSDAYQRARAQDVRAIERQVVTALVHGPESLEHRAVPDGAVLIVDELDPATAAGLDASRLAGIVTVRGGSTGHGVIVARSRGIPIYTDGGETAAAVQDSTIVGFDVSARLLVVDPDQEQTERLTDLLDRRRSDAAEATRRATEPAVTTDGVRVRVGANLTSQTDADTAAALGAEGSGLVRTEILFGTAMNPPAATDQATIFTVIGRTLGAEPVTIRTWDVGGDKSLPFLPGPQEANPMLGVQGIRLMRQHSQLFDDQLLAVCGAAEQTPLRVMFPMVTTRDEVDWALGRLAAARAMVGTPELDVGIMIEVPAAAIRVRELAEGLDFVSIGTNDLTQYTLAADRGNAGVGDVVDSLDPAVLQLIRQVVHDVPDGVDVGVCGDLASQVDAVPLLIGLGIRELSVVGPMVPRIKQAVRHTNAADASRLAEQALRASSARAVRELLADPR